MCSSQRPPVGPRGHTGAAAERAAAAYLEGLGWTVMARNLWLGRDELDLVARPPAPTGGLVVVEVRARSGPSFGAATESVDARKVARLYRAVATLRRGGHPSLGSGPVRGPIRVDLVTLRRHGRDGWTVDGHLQGLEPPG
jgi:Holliday junction resolvase-like predicted endonuclease